MGMNCFDCSGIVALECVNERRYVPYGNSLDDGCCLYFEMAKEDMIKLNCGETKYLNLRSMLAEYLTSKGQVKKALEILSKS
jgi:hypothetical protein